MTEPPLAVVLLSGGLDSCVAAAIAARENRLAFLHLNYRQRTEARELRAFQDLAAHFGVSQRLVVDVSFMQQIGGTSLIDPSLPVPENHVDERRLPSTYVPFRNANLLGIAVAWAETIEAGAVFIGAHEEESAYPDCRREFIEAYARMVAAGIRTDRPIRIRAPLIDMDKAAIVRCGRQLEAPLHLTWSCYQREDLACGRCHSCRIRRRGFRTAGVEDPLPYAL